MISLVARRTVAIGIVGIGALATTLVPGSMARAALRPTDPAQVVPLDQIAPQHREQVAEVIRDHTFHRKGEPETFPCHPKIYLSLLNEPGLTLALWQDLSTSPVKLRQVGPNLYQGTDGAGATATWEFVVRDPKLHVLLCNLEYVSPRGNAKLEGRIVLVVHTGYYREVNGDPWVQHDVEAFVKIDSRGWKAVARTVRPVIEKLLEDQVREAGWFVSLMGRLVAMYPNWACEVTMKPIGVAPESLQKFRETVVQNRRPGASNGRPALAENAPENTRRR